MENIDPERAKAWIFTLVLGIAVCMGLIIYTLITLNPAFSFIDSSLFKPELAWLGCIGFILSFITYLLFWISSSILRYLPNEKQWLNPTAIAGLFSLLLTYILLFLSYDLENCWMHYVGYIGLITGANMIFTKEVVDYKVEGKLAKILHIIGTIILFSGMGFMINYWSV